MKVSRENQILLTVMVASVLTPFNGSAINMCLPSIQHEFAIPTATLGWLVELYLICCTVMLLPAGKIANIYGKKKVFLTGAIILTIVSAVAHFVTTYPMLLLITALQGVSSALIFSTSMAIVAIVFPPEKRGKAMGLVVAIVYIALAAGPALGGFLNYQFGWRSIYYFTTALSAISSILTLVVMREDWVAEPNGRFHKMGFILYALAIVFIMAGLSSIHSAFWGPYALVVGLFVAWLFVRSQLASAKPLLPVRIFSENLGFSLANLAAMLNYSATFAIAFLLSVYLQLVMGYNSQTAGLILLVQTVIMAILSPVTGTLADRYSPALLASSGMAVTACGLGLMIGAVHLQSMALIIICLLIIGVGFAFFSAPNQTSIMNSVKPGQFGTASSIIGTVRLIGQVLSMAVVTSILSLHWAEHALLSNIEISFAIFTLFCVIGIIPSLSRSKV